ncbi:TetR/AcrR family transcriptional regulator [Desertimonas flava]|jgi:AcrR family transcriptional regulator|uniref:TetR/AcrR family transcriptional regulator n=1 Tax=Desertimonas flava TaxID=2064846 RepID=UPI000E353D87|nr:TetR family transcriptional regulator C-terminal domain-containing protein [Desertimonas flava]
MPKVVDVDQRRGEIVDATMRLIARGGLGAATMRDIAAEAGWTTGVVNHYFADKRELLRQTLQQSIRRRVASRSHTEDTPPAQRLRDELAAALPLDEEGRMHWLVTAAFLSQAAGDAELATVQRDAYRAFRANVAALVEATDGVDAATARERAEQLIASIDGVAMQAMFDPESWPPQRQLALLDAALGAD